jgi:hypothetical protein
MHCFYISGVCYLAKLTECCCSLLRVLIISWSLCVSHSVGLTLPLLKTKQGQLEVAFLEGVMSLLVKRRLLPLVEIYLSVFALIFSVL